MNQSRANRYFIWSLVVFFGGMIIFGITHYASKRADLKGEQVSHTECTVYAKYDKKVSRGRAADRNYFIDSSCGLFRADSQALSDTLEVGQAYDWSATVGNWANKPTIISAKSTLSFWANGLDDTV